MQLEDLLEAAVSLKDILKGITTTITPVTLCRTTD